MDGFEIPAPSIIVDSLGLGPIKVGYSRVPLPSPSPELSPKPVYAGFFGGAGSTAYTPSSGSSKTDPAPFLSDFSAFLK